MLGITAEHPDIGLRIFGLGEIEEIPDIRADASMGRTGKTRRSKSSRDDSDADEVQRSKPLQPTQKVTPTSQLPE
jgi:hypothetical protein